MKVVNIDPLVEFLKREFESRKERNNSYSLRAFANFLDIDPSNLSKILSYQLSLGEKLKIKLSHKLGLDFKDSMNRLQYQKTDDTNYIKHGLDLFSLISDWYHYAILEIIKLDRPDNICNKVLIAKELGLSKQTVSEALKRLERFGLIEVNHHDGSIKNVTDSSSSILDVKTSKAHRNHQKQILEKAIDALETVPIEKRSQSSMTIAIDKEKLPEAIEMIKDFRRKISRFLSESNQLNDVYHLSVSLYPITTIHNEESK